MMEHVTKADINAMFDTPLGCPWPRYRKKVLTPMLRMSGPFTVETKEGPLTCPDGYLAIDTEGWPYPISVGDHEAMYEPAAASAPTRPPIDDSRKEP